MTTRQLGVASHIAGMSTVELVVVRATNQRTRRYSTPTNAKNKHSNRQLDKIPTIIPAEHLHPSTLPFKTVSLPLSNFIRDGCCTPVPQ